MPKKGYVKSTIQSGAGSELLNIEKNKAANVTSYTVSGVSLPKNAARYFHSSIHGSIFSVYCYIGANDKGIEIDEINIMIKSYVDPASATLDSNNYIVEIVRANFTGATTISPGSYKYSAIVAADSSSPSPALQVKIDPTGLTNQEVIFSGLVHSDFIKATAIPMQTQDLLLPFSRTLGKPISIIGSNQCLLIRFTLGAAGYLTGNIQSSWYEI